MGLIKSVNGLTRICKEGKSNSRLQLLTDFIITRLRKTSRWQLSRDKLSCRDVKMRCKSALSSHRFPPTPRWAVIMRAGDRAKALRGSSKVKRNSFSEKKAGLSNRMIRKIERYRICSRQATWAAIASRSLEEGMIVIPAEQVAMARSWAEITTIGETLEHQGTHLVQDRGLEDSKMLLVEAGVGQEADSSNQLATPRSLWNKEALTDLVHFMMTLEFARNNRDRQKWSLTGSRRRCNNSRPAKIPMKCSYKHYIESLLTQLWQFSRKLGVYTLSMFFKKWKCSMMKSLEVKRLG